MPITTIKELRILPPFAIGRLGSSPDPMDNYSLEIKDPVGFRELAFAETLIVDRRTGEITAAVTPKGDVRFRDASGHIRPVSPFLEVWARFEDEGRLVPLTKTHLADLKLLPRDVQWSVHVGNIKAYRRTGNPNDKIEAKTGVFGDNGIKQLEGRCENFKPDKFIPLGSVQYVSPTDVFPEIRLRFTPASGKVYGPRKDTNSVDDVYDATKGRWPQFFDRDDDRRATIPAEIYAGVRERTTAPGQPQHLISRGYLDDECDGIVDVRLTWKSQTSARTESLSAFARIAAGPPTFAPDSLPIRTVADELEQAMFGPDILGPVTLEEARDIVRRALETVRLMNTAYQNGARTGMARMDSGDVNRASEPIMDPAVVDALAVRARHERVLLALDSGTLAWFARILRDYDQVGDLSNEGRRKMPAMMRGADSRHLALTRRQVNKIRTAAASLEKPSGQTKLNEQRA